MEFYNFAFMCRSCKYFRRIPDFFRDAVHSLRKKALKAKRLAGELSIAHDIQMELLPKAFSPFPGHPSLSLYAKQRPAREVGGDFYDFFISDEKLVFAVGDVSGKGIPAAIVMAVTKSLFRAFASSNPEPSDIASRLNASLTDNNEANMFVTMFIGMLDLNTRMLHWCNAGHNPPLLISDEFPPEYVKAKHVSLPIGVMPDTEYKTESIFLCPFERLIVYTDGLSEAENSDHELLGEERLSELCDKFNTLPPKELLDSIDDSLAQFVGGAKQSDDLTMLAIHYGGWFRDYDKGQKVGPDIGYFISGIAEDIGLDQVTANRINLAVEELTVNALEYAYPEGERGRVSVSATFENNILEFRICDEGRPFDPTMAPDPDLTLDADSRPVGGLGIFLARKIMDEIVYRREGKRNVVTMRKRMG